MSAPIRVLIVDDSNYVRLVLKRMLSQARGIEVVGLATDGLEAVHMAARLKPDVITLDVEMPRLDGLGFLRRVLPRNPIPVVMLSSLTQQGAAVTLEALELGAVDFMGKPGSAGVPDLKSVERQLIARIRGAAKARVFTAAPRRPVPQVMPALPRTRSANNPVILIASSTGGPHTLAELLSALPANLPASLAITQHMPPAFTEALAARLDRCSSLTVRQAAAGDVLEAGTALLAPGDYHMIIGPHGIVHLSQEPSVCGVRPAANPMMTSAATNLRCPLVALILTGMGSDGAEGAVAVKQAGGTVIAQDEHTSVIYGMPRAAADTGSCDHIAALHDIPALLIQVVSKLVQTRQPVLNAQEG